MWPADLITFTQEILNGKLHILCSVLIVSHIIFHVVWQWLYESWWQWDYPFVQVDQSIQRDVLWFLWVNLILNGIIHLLIYFFQLSTLNALRMLWYLMQSFLRFSWHLKVTQPFLYFWVNQVYIILSKCNVCASSPRWIFISSPVDFLVSPAENVLLGLIPEKF